MLCTAGPTRLLCCSLLLSLIACSSTDPASSGPTAVRDQRLHALMVGELDQELARLDALAFDLHLTPGELDAVRERRRRAIALNAAQLRNSAAEILALQSELGLAATAAPQFNALARQLQDTAASLEQQATTGQLQQLGATMRALSGTCQACHSLYRER